jgi:SSS family solute:Na+ symporter
VFWSADLPKTQMGLNLTVGDLDFPESGNNNWGNFHHENWWAGEKDKRTWLKQWGTMTLYGGYKPMAVE